MMSRTHPKRRLFHRMTAALLAAALMASAAPVKAISPATDVPQVLSAGTTFSLTQSARSMDFNEDWTFSLNPSGNDATLSAAGFDDSAWRTLNLPHDWSIEQDFTNQVSSEIGHLPGGTGWYRKSFVLPAELQGKRINIDFDGVYMDSHIWINGKKVGNYPNGYIPFSFDVTDYVVCDGKTENVIAVKVTNITQSGNVGNQSSRWYSGSGIYRDVHMTVTDPVHVAQYGMVVSTPDIASEAESGNITVNVGTTVENETKETVDVQVRSTILNYKDGSAFGEPITSEAQTVPANGKVDVAQTMTADHPGLWSPDSPTLYKMKTEILVNDQVKDTYETRFGFSWSEFLTATEAEKEGTAFKLNGEPMKLHGVCMHHDQGALGAVGNAAAIERQMKMMKEMGVNSIRVTHNPASPELMRICDEMGLTVVEEAFDTWYGGKKNYDYHRFFEAACSYPGVEQGTTWAQFDLQQMIRSDRNSPSIIAWSLGNEIGETSQQKGLTTVKNLVKWAKEIDTEHPVTMGEDKFRMSRYGGDALPVQVADQLDVVGFNYAEDNYDYYKNLRPNWRMYGSETSSAIKSRGYYSDPAKNTGAQYVVDHQLSSYDNLAVGWGKTATNSWIPDRDRTWIAGQYIWTGFDYIGEPTPWNQDYNAPPKSSYFGIVDTAGIPKDDYYLYQSQWLDVEDAPMVHIFPHWNWENNNLRSKVTVDGGKIPVRVYSNAPTVELTVSKPNGERVDIGQAEKSFFVKNGHPQQSESSDRLYLEWQIPWEYAVGTTITATAKDESGKTVATDTVVTAGEAAKLGLSADRQVIEADGYDLSYITVDVQDASGNLLPTAMNEMSFRVRGNGTIVGVDNGDPASWERFKDTNGQWTRSAFNGKAVVIVQSTKDAGSFTLTAQSAGLESDSITVYTANEDQTEDTILGYEVASLMTDVGVVPSEEQMPKSVYAVYANGSKKEMAVTWDHLSAEDLSKPSEVTVQGTVTETGAQVSMVITVRGSVGVQPVSVITQVGQIPTLPREVTVVWSDGKTETKKVTWPEITAEQVAQQGTFTVESTEVADTDFVAVAHVRVVAGGEDRNIALASMGTTVAVSYEEGVHRPAQLIDGNKADENGWGNWQSGGRKSDTATLTFPQEYNIGRVKVWINTKSSKTWQKPDQIQVEYWNGSDWAAVENQSKNTDFAGWSDHAQPYDGEEITFNPVSTNKLRFTFSVNAYTGGKDMMKIMELEAFSNVLPVESDATLTDLRVDGKTIKDFDPSVTGYLVATDFKAEIPEVTATAAGNATVFVRQAISNNGTAVVTVTSEDGRTKKEYTIQFVRQDAALDMVSIVQDDLDRVTEDDVITLSAVGTLQDETEITSANAVTTYEVSDGSGHAEIQNGKLYAYDAGDVEITASMSYRGKIVKSEPISVSIAENPEEKWVESFEAVTVRTSPGTEPELPDTVMVNFNTGLPRSVDVEWDEIPADAYAQMNTFTVNGTADVDKIVDVDKDIQPTATVLVVSVIATQHVSMAVPEGYAPDLPAQVTVFFSDGSSGELPVKWKDANEAIVDDVTTYHGTVSYSGETFDVTATVRVGEASESPNYVIVRNGYDLPIGLASYTNNRDSQSTDNATHLNDGNSSFVLDGKKIWCNWVRNGHRTSDWVSVTIANEGVPVQKTVNSIRVGFMDEKGGNGSIALPKDYVVEYYTGPIDYDLDLSNVNHVAEWTDSPLVDDSNWKEVSYVDEKPEPQDGEMTEVVFAPVTTHLVRVRMDAKENHSLGVNELEVYGQIAAMNETFKVKSLEVAGEDHLNDFDSDNTLTISLDHDAQFPEITASATKNAAVTVIPATMQNPVAIVRIVPESGAETAIEEYKIIFEREDLPEPVPTFTVTFDSMGGSPVAAQKVQSGNPVVRPQDPTYADHIFRGWYKDQDCTKPFDFSTTIEKDMTLYAKWEEVQLPEPPSGGGGAHHPEAGGSSDSDSDKEDHRKPDKEETVEIQEPEVPMVDRPLMSDGAQFNTKTNAGDVVTVSAKQNGNRYEISFKQDGKKIDFIKDGVVIKIPIDENGMGVVAIATNEQGIDTVLKTSYPEGNDLVATLYAPGTIRVENRAVSFADVPSTAWFKNAVDFVTARNLFSGISAQSFAPDQSMNRGMLATVLYRLAGEPPVTGAVGFGDVPADQYYANAVAWAAQNQVASGITASEFSPDAAITREQLATILYRYSGSPAVSASLDRFADASLVSEYAVTPLQWATEQGIISGRGNGTLDPKGTASRAEVAQMLMNLVAK